MKDGYSDEKVLVTGGLGFIGSNLVHELVDRGAHVTVLDSLSDEYGGNMFNVSEIKGEISIVNGDVRQESVVRDVVNGQDVVFHLAAQLSRVISMDEPKIDAQVNCIGTLHVLEAVRELEPSAKVIYTSSQAVYGPSCQLPITEQTPTNPIDIYGCNKLAAEEYMSIYNNVHDVFTNSLRLTNVYGPRAQLDNPKYGVVNKFLRLALENRELTVYKPGDVTRDFIFVGDVVDALLKSGRCGTPGERYVIGSGKSISIADLAKTIVRVAERGSVEFTEWPDEWNDIRMDDISVKPDKVQTELSWSPKTELSEGLRKTVEYYDHNLTEYI